MTNYEAVIQSLPDAVLVLDLEDRVISANAMLGRLFNIEPATIIGKTTAEVFPGKRTFSRHYKDLTEGRIETHVSGRFVEMLISPLKDDDGTLLGRVILMRDVTVSKTARNVLIASERRYRALFENSNDAIFIIDFNLTILLANARASLMLDVPLEDLLNSSARTYFKPEQFDEMEKGVMTLLSGDPAPVYEQTLIRSNGMEIPTEVSLTLVRDSSGDPMHIQSIVRDISE